MSMDIMEDAWVYFISALLLVLLAKVFSKRKTGHRNLPPCPPSLPLIGHLHLLKNPVHRTLQSMSYKYGPIIALSFGSRNVLIVSSPSSVEECFNKNDLVFANRPHLRVGKHLHYNSTTLGASNYGSHWRNLRRLASIEIFSSSRLNLFLNVRREEVRSLLRNLYKVSGTSSAEVEMKSKLSALSFNIIMRMSAGKRYFGEEVEDVGEATRFREIMKEVFQLSGVGNPGDFVPLLRWIDFGGKGRKVLALKESWIHFCKVWLTSIELEKEIPVRTGMEVLLRL